jgi:flagellar protein FliS
MWNNAHNAYLESRILTADPLELIRLMYQAAVAEVRGARQHLANKEIALRSNAISKACAILTKLVVSLDRKKGGEYAERLYELYGYMMHKLTEANFKQQDEPLVEVMGLLSTLLEGWDGVQSQMQAAQAPVAQTAAGAHEWAHAPAGASVWAHAPEASHTSQAWSF